MHQLANVDVTPFSDKYAVLDKRKALSGFRDFVTSTNDEIPSITVGTWRLGYWPALTEAVKNQLEEISGLTVTVMNLKDFDEANCDLILTDVSFAFPEDGYSGVYHLAPEFLAKFDPDWGASPLTELRPTSSQTIGYEAEIVKALQQRELVIPLLGSNRVSLKR